VIQEVRAEQINKRDFKTTFNVTRQEEAPDEMIIEGYFALFENETELFEGVHEIISRGAFDKTLNNDIRALWNHNTQYVLGRNKSGSLELKSDEKGLYASIRLPKTQYAQDLYELVKRGDVDQCSFGFNITGEDLEELASGGYRWRINEADLHEVSVVTFPAYENTSVQARAKQVEQIEKRKLDQKKSDLQKKNLEVRKNVEATKTSKINRAKT
jgi:HK97 family phage prohead protease